MKDIGLGFYHVPHCMIMTIHTQYPTGKSAIVDDRGTELFFVDSGAVPDSDNYTTVILVHGSGVTGKTLHHLLPYAPPSNIRLVIPNRRDYPGSTPYTDEELGVLKAGEESAMEKVAREIAGFCKWFIENQSLPRISSDRKNGGIVLMGWSMGNATTISLIGWPNAIAKETLDLLKGYVRRLIVWGESWSVSLTFPVVYPRFTDAPHLALGLLETQPLKGYNPLVDPTLEAPVDAVVTFCNWVTGYYDHPDLSLREASTA
ncbi:hypothetical protein K435DRAFT_423701, partial [Dendrothele bispora CBS 962.96]